MTLTLTHSHSLYHNYKTKSKYKSCPSLYINTYLPSNKYIIRTCLFCLYSHKKTFDISKTRGYIIYKLIINIALSRELYNHDKKKIKITNGMV